MTRPGTTGTAVIRDVTPDDLAAVVRMVHDLAEYEREPESCHLTVDQLRLALFGPTPAVFGHVAVVDGAVAGFTLWFLNFSTWEGVHGIYLEDLYVRPEYRSHGLGKALLLRLARTAQERGYARVEWSVLDWNTPSIDFYRAFGATPMSGWTTYRLTGPALARRAAESS